MDYTEKTSYETDPVESLYDAMLAFAKAYDNLQYVLQEELQIELSNELRRIIYRPVQRTPKSLPISMYEVGLIHRPNKSVAGRYTFNEKKLQKAINTRETDVQALLVMEGAGILPYLCDKLSELREMEHEYDENDEESSYNQYHENAYVYSNVVRGALLKFLNECRRLTALWSS